MTGLRSPIRPLICGLLLAGCAKAPVAACELSGAKLQAHVLDVLERDFPHVQVREGEADDVLLLADAELGLTNVGARVCEAAPQGGKAADDVIREHFANIFAAIESGKRASTTTWADVRSRLRLQLMPAEYRDRIETAPVARDFVDGVAISVVVDDSTSYRYVTPRDLDRWSITADALFAAAHAATPEPALSGDTSGGLLSIASGDGYDAARIVDPSTRRAAAAALGEPFHVAFPNRDFLLLWNGVVQAQSGDRIAAQVREDCARQSHPLSCDVYRAWADGRIEPMR